MKYLFLLLVLSISFVGKSIKPDPNYIQTPTDLGLDFESYQIPTSDGAVLNAWKINAVKEQKKFVTLIVAYGDAGNMSCQLNQAAILSQLGFDILLFDYRGFGKSSLFEINQDQLYYAEFITDLISVVQFCKLKFRENKTGIWAQSMGTIMATQAVQKEKVDFLVLEGFVLSPTLIKQRIKEFKAKELSLPEEDNSFHLDQIQIPVLIFSGKADIFTTLSDAKLFCKAAPKRKIVEFKGNHLEGFSVLSGRYFGEIYCRKIIRFVKKV
ncbi:MAG: alpha/beta hydrolase [Sediminibacterium sp.]